VRFAKANYIVLSGEILLSISGNLDGRIPAGIPSQKILAKIASTRPRIPALDFSRSFRATRWFAYESGVMLPSGVERRCIS
jgi:hypothetical protein